MINWIAGYLVAGMRQIVCAIIGAFLYYIVYMVKTLFGMMPDEWSLRLGTGIDEAFKYWAWADYYLPMSQTWFLCKLYVGVWIASICFKWAVKLMRG